MFNFIKFSEAASIALHSMVYMARKGGINTTGDISERLKVSEAHLSKVLQRLAKNGLVKSTRGPGGGFTPGLPISQIKLIDIYQAIEGPLTDHKCLFDTPSCGNGKCIFGNTPDKIEGILKNFLYNTRLSELTDIYMEVKQ